MSRPNSSNICFTTTAMPRPELLEKTYSSFRDRIKWLDFKSIPLFLNIDKFPYSTDYKEQDANIDRVKEIASSYFSNVVVNIGFSCFPQAVKWIFSQANTEYVFNLEDDWELLCDIPSRVTEFFDNPDVLQVGFRAWKRSDPRFVLSPSIIKTSFCNFAASKMHTAKNPEEQIRNLNPYNPSKSFVYWPFEDDKVILRDLGRSWIKTSCYGRGLDDFTQWRFLPNSTTRWRDQQCQDQSLDIDLSKLDGNFRGPNVSN